MIVERAFAGVREASPSPIAWRAAQAKGIPSSELTDAVRNRRRDDWVARVRPVECCRVRSEIMLPPSLFARLNGIETVTADTTGDQPTLDANWIDRTGKLHRHVHIEVDS